MNVLFLDSIDTAQITVGSAISAGDNIGFHHESSSWSVKEYGTVENAFSLCTFIGMCIIEAFSIIYLTVF